MPRLVAQSPEFAGQSFDLSGPEITVGRVADNKIQVEHASVSGHHAILKLDALDYVIRDLDSTNGTRVNGERVSEQKLRRNDVVRLGNIELLYDSEHAPPGRPMPNPSQRVNLAECSSNGRPAEFVNASPVTKRAKGSGNKIWTLILVVLGLLAVAGIGYFVWVVFLTPTSVS
ncbi:MAG: FHA domain-containing protein [Methylacidiphilales bacterium]|nr:FHA domain-containing protein [Candidatus Methylacidiphilales bacterium]